MKTKSIQIVIVAVMCILTSLVITACNKAELPEYIPVPDNNTVINNPTSDTQIPKSDDPVDTPSVDKPPINTPEETDVGPIEPEPSPNESNEPTDEKLESYSLNYTMDIVTNWFSDIVSTDFHKKTIDGLLTQYVADLKDGGTVAINTMAEEFVGVDFSYPLIEDTEDKSGVEILSGYFCSDVAAYLNAGMLTNVEQKAILNGLTNLLEVYGAVTEPVIVCELQDLFISGYKDHGYVILQCSTPHLPQ